MKQVHFIDTTVMDNILNLPGKNQQYQKTKEELQRLVKAKDILILPATTVIESGVWQSYRSVEGPSWGPALSARSSIRQDIARHRQRKRSLAIWPTI